jgi:hypothetical protein
LIATKQSHEILYIKPPLSSIKTLANKIFVILAFFFSLQEISATLNSEEDRDYPGRDNHFVLRRLEAEEIIVNQGTFVRPKTFESWRSVYWVKPNAGATSINVNVTVEKGLNVAFKQDGQKKAAHSDNGIFDASFALNNGKSMTEIEVIITDGTSERSYYLDVCASDPQSHDVVVNYYGLLPYPETRSATRALVDQITGGYNVTPPRIDFAAKYLAGSQKNYREFIDAVKAINPNWHSLHYHLSIWNGQAAILIDNKWSEAEWEYLVNELFKQDPYIFLYAKHKNTGKTTWLKDLTWGAYLMNISNETYYQHLLKNLESQCQSTGYESVFFDSFALGTVYSFTNYNYINFGAGDNVPKQFTEYQNPQLGGLTWLQASEEFISRLNKDLNRRGIWLLPNHGNMQTSWDPLDYALTNGGMLEGTPMKPDNSRNTSDRLYLYDWLQSMSRTMYLTQKDRIIILQPYLPDINNLNYRMFVLGEYLLVRGKYTYLNICIHGQAQASWYPEYEIDLGAPTQTHIIPDTLFTPWKESIDKAIINYQEGDLFVRRFEKGLVVLNPHRTARQYTTPADRVCKAAVISGGGTVPESGIGNLAYSLSWKDVPKGAANTIPAESALILHFETGVDTEFTESITEKINVYESNGYIQITSTPSNLIHEVSVYNLQGALIYRVNDINTISHTLNLNQPAGVYIVKVISAKRIDNIKIRYE